MLQISDMQRLTNNTNEHYYGSEIFKRILNEINRKNQLMSAYTDSCYCDGGGYGDSHHSDCHSDCYSDKN